MCIYIYTYIYILFFAQCQVDVSSAMANGFWTHALAGQMGAWHASLGPGGC